MTDAEIDELLKHLLPELEEMANNCSLNLELWNRFSNNVIKADAIIRYLNNKLADESLYLRATVLREAAGIAYDAHFDLGTYRDHPPYSSAAFAIQQKLLKMANDIESEDQNDSIHPNHDPQDRLKS